MNNPISAMANFRHPVIVSYILSHEWFIGILTSWVSERLIGAMGECRAVRDEQHIHLTSTHPCITGIAGSQLVMVKSAWSCG